MERLTYRAELGVSIDKNEDCPTCSICWNCDIKAKDCRYFNDAVEKLANYEDAEEQGLLLRLPCKVGDKVFYVDSIRKFVDECEIRRIECKSIDARHMGITLEMIGSLWHCVRAELIGNDIFLTKEEAEQALKQMGE